MYLFKNGKVSALRHVLTPAVSLSYRPDYSDEKYGYFKYVQADTTGRQIQYSIFNNTVYGGPSAGQFANLSFSLDNNLEMKVNTKSDTGATEKKVKILESFQLSSNYNMIADSMQLGPIRVNGRTSLAEKVSLNFGGLLNPYAYDNLNRTYYDEYSISADGPLVRLTSANVSMNFSLRPSNKPKEDSRYSKEELDYINNHPEEFVDFDVPYNLTVSYSLGYSKTGDQKALTTQSASFNGDLSLTPQFKIGFNSWYDITNKQFTNFGVNFFRDLHCWEMRLNWIPFGYQESWSFQINVKSSILQDLKLQKKKDYFDN
jgi:LptD protein